MRAVWKYELGIEATPQVRPMPRAAAIVHVDTQHGTPTLWAEVDPNNTLVDRTFMVHGTGHPIEHDGNWVGTVLAHGDTLVWHIYEVAS